MSVDPYTEVIAGKLADVLSSSRDSESLPETLWLAAMARIEIATGAKTEFGQNWTRWRSYPRGELQRLRRDVSDALRLARLAAELQDAHNAGWWEADRPAREARAAADHARGRAQTLEAELVRLANNARRKATDGGAPTTREADALRRLEARPRLRRQARGE